MLDIKKEQLDNSEETKTFYEVLGPANTVADFVSELYDSLFRDILGDSIMDRSLGSFTKDELFRIMSCVFLQDANGKIYNEIYEKTINGG